ncbi:MAG: PHP domain-containing protein, partial [Chloroflexi bacterium]|nr:PHP domain-containing protein [Chloroflexota bacterium]
MTYVELHAKSFFSFGLGASHIHELLAQAAESGMPALALTDTNLCGALEFARQAKSLEVQPITGGELTLADGSRLVLLTKTRAGYANLSRLFTLANEVDRRDPKH